MKRQTHEELRGPATRRLLGAFAVGALSTIVAALLAALLLRQPLSAALGGWEAARNLAKVTGFNCFLISFDRVLHFFEGCDRVFKVFLWDCDRI